MAEGLPFIPDPLIGARVNQFRIKAKLAEGGMGAVYVAEHERFSKMRKVVKVLLPEYARHPMIRHRFEREAEAASRLKHDNILAIDNFGTLDDGQLFLMVAFLDGKPLDAYLRDRDGRLPEHRALHIAIQLCAALDHAHRAGVIHRDLKPGNVFIIPTDKNPYAVKLLDFGVAKLQGDTSEGVFTHTGIGIGTPSYMAVEQYEHAGDVTPTADIYSLAIIIWEMVTGDLPWGRFPSLSVYYHKQLTTQPQRPPPELMSAAWCDILLAALRADPAMRPQTARELAVALASATPASSDLPSGAEILADLAPGFVTAADPSADTVRNTVAVDRVAPLVWPKRETNVRARAAALVLPPLNVVTSGGEALPSNQRPSTLVDEIVAIERPRAEPVTANERPRVIAVQPAPTLDMPAGALPAPRPARRTRLILLGVAAGALAGGITFAMVKLPGQMSSSSDDVRSPAGPGPSDPGPIASLAPGSAGHDAAVAVAATPDAGLRDAAMEAAAVVEPRDTPPEPSRAASISPPAITARGPAAPAPRRGDVTASAPAPGNVRSMRSSAPAGGTAASRDLQTGTIVIKVKPWAAVWIDGKPVGQTPVRRALPAGSYRVRIEGADQHEEVTVTVRPGQELTLQRKW